MYEKVYEILKKTEILDTEEKNYICSHIKVLPLREIECMILQIQMQLLKTEKYHCILNMKKI